jgi:hypothetical protein
LSPGHAYSVGSLAAALADGIEDAVWGAVWTLDEGGALLEQLARHLRNHQDDQGAAALEERAADAKRRADQMGLRMSVSYLPSKASGDGSRLA